MKIVRRVLVQKQAPKTRDFRGAKVRLMPVTTSATHQARIKYRRLKRNRSWGELQAFVAPAAKRATLRKFVTTSYVPQTPAVRASLGLAPLPALAADLLSIIHGPARSRRRARR